MKVVQGSWDGKGALANLAKDEKAQLVLYFGSYEILKNSSIYNKFKDLYPNAYIAGCSTGGEIFDRQYNEDSCSYCVISLDKSSVQGLSKTLTSADDSYAVGKELATELSKKDKLRAIFILSEGLQINGSDLVRGVNETVDTSKVVVTGGPFHPLQDLPARPSLCDRIKVFKFIVDT